MKWTGSDRQVLDVVAAHWPRVRPGAEVLDATPPEFLRVNHYAPSINADRECPEVPQSGGYLGEN